MTATIVGLRGELAGKRFTVGSEPITFGRGSENAVVLTTPSASRIHAELRQEADRYILYDRGSTNGTRVNNALVPSTSSTRAIGSPSATRSSGPKRSKRRRRPASASRRTAKRQLNVPNLSFG